MKSRLTARDIAKMAMADHEGKNTNASKILQNAPLILKYRKVTR